MHLSKLLRSAALSLVLGFAPLVPASADTLWTDGNGDWLNPANWSAGVPGQTGLARVNNGGTAQIAVNAGSASATLGSAAGDSGNLVISGAGRLDGSVYVGDSGTGTLNITDGAMVTSGGVYLGGSAGSIGTAVISGVGSKWTHNAYFDVGFAGTGSLNILSGGTLVTNSNGIIAENNGGRGTVTVDGTGSTWNCPGTITVAGNGNGTLVVTNGGKVITGGSGGSFGSEVSRNPGASGLAVISGAGSRWMNSGSLSVGSLSSGSTLMNGRLQVTDAGAVSNSNGIIGGSSGSASVEVRGTGSTWTNNGNLSVSAYAGGGGDLSVREGGKVTSVNGYIGNGAAGSAPSLGTVTIDGNGSTWTNSGNLYVGGNATGGAGTGVMRLTNAGTATANTTTVWTPGTLEVGANGKLNGVLTFSGGKLRAIGSTTFTNAASLTATGALVDSNSFDLTITGAISGTAGLTKIGPGTLTLTNANTYAGPTTINTGRLFANNSAGSAIGNGTVTVNIGAVLGGTGAISAPITVQSGGALLGGNSSAPSGSLKISNDLTLNSGSTIELVLGNSGAHSALQRTGGTWSFASNQSFVFVNAGAQPGFYDNIISGLTSDPGVANWTISGGSYSGFFTYDGAGNVDLTLTAVPPAAEVVAAGSRKTHGATGNFFLNLPLGNPPAVECRSGGASGDHSIVITFNNAVVGGNATVSAGAATLSGPAIFTGNTMTVNLTGVSNAQTVTIGLESVTDAYSQIVPDSTLSVAFLLGDSNSDSAVNSGDAIITRNRSGQPVDATNFRVDYNLDGMINSGDTIAVRSGSGTVIP